MVEFIKPSPRTGYDLSQSSKFLRSVGKGEPMLHLGLWDALFDWKIPPASEMQLASADVIVTHEFGDQKNVSATTAAIVDRGILLAKKFGKPLICQYPGNEAAAVRGVNPVAVIFEHMRKPGAYLDTEEVNRQVAEICRVHGWRRVILCAHPHHLWRAASNLKRHGMIPLYPDVTNVRYDARCSRAALRTPRAFLPREVAARMLYFKKGWLA